MEVNKSRCGIAFGAFLGLSHAAWSLLVAIGFAQPAADFVLRLHMIRLPLEVQPFSAALAAALVVFTSCVGYAGGWVLAYVWNRLQKP